MFHLCRLIFAIVSTSPQTSEKTSLICAKKEREESQRLLLQCVIAVVHGSFADRPCMAASQHFNGRENKNKCQFYASHIISAVISRLHMISTDSQQSVMVHRWPPTLDNGWWVCFNLTLLRQHNGDRLVNARNAWTISISWKRYPIRRARHIVNERRYTVVLLW